MQFEVVPAGDLPYRVVLDAERPDDVFRLSTRTHTEWTFRSDTVDSDFFEPFSVLQLDYRLETDLHGDVLPGRAADRAAAVVLAPRRAARRPVTAVTLDISSDDGAAWQPVALTLRTDGWWQGVLPADHGGAQHLSIRGSATTGNGYSISQEVIRAYGLGQPAG